MINTGAMNGTILPKLLLDIYLKLLYVVGSNDLEKHLTPLLLLLSEGALL